MGSSSEIVFHAAMAVKPKASKMYQTKCSTHISALADVVPQPRWQLCPAGGFLLHEWHPSSQRSPRCSLGHLRIFSFKLDPSPILSINSS